MFTLQKVVQGICNFVDENGKPHGYCILTEKPDHSCNIKLELVDLPSGEHGFHIHKSADMRKGPASCGEHYNPFNKTHGDLISKERHLGDLGNIIVDSKGKCNSQIDVEYLPLKSDNHIQIIGRSMIIHADMDDKGLGGFPDSKSNGHSGARLFYGIIGYL